MDRASSEPGEDLQRLDLPHGVYTGIWWCARFLNHYAGNGALADKALGEFDMKAWSDDIANALRAIKFDQTTLRLKKRVLRKSSASAGHAAITSSPGLFGAARTGDQLDIH